MNDVLAGKVGKARPGTLGWEYIAALGAVGGSHYLIAEMTAGGTAGRFGSKVVSLSRLEPYDFYDRHRGRRRGPRACTVTVRRAGERTRRMPGRAADTRRGCGGRTLAVLGR